MRGIGPSRWPWPLTRRKSASLSVMAGSLDQLVGGERQRAPPFAGGPEQGVADSGGHIVRAHLAEAAGAKLPYGRVGDVLCLNGDGRDVGARGMW